MKKLLALAIAVVMMMAIALPVFAADGAESKSTWGDTDLTPGASAEQTNFDQVVLEYGVAQAYEVTIPADINFGYMDGETDPESNVLSGTRNVSVSNAVIAGTEQLIISVVSKNGWTMVDTYGKSTSVSYSTQVGSRVAFSEKYDNNGDTDDGDPICTVMVVDAATGNKGTEVDNNQTVTLTFTTAGTAQEGLYQDILTFSVQIREMANADDDYRKTFAGEKTLAA